MTRNILDETHAVKTIFQPLRKTLPIYIYFYDIMGILERCFVHVRRAYVFEFGQIIVV